MLVLNHYEYVIVGLRNMGLLSEPPLREDVMWSGDGGRTWFCLGGDPRIGAGSEVFVISQLVSIAQLDGSAATRSVSSVCVSGGRPLLPPTGTRLAPRKAPSLSSSLHQNASVDEVPGRWYGGPQSAVWCASVTAATLDLLGPPPNASSAAASSPSPPQLLWRRAPDLPAGVTGHVFVDALPNPYSWLAHGDSSEPLGLLLGGQRSDGSEDVWIALPRDASWNRSSVIYPSLAAAMEADLSTPGGWVRLPVVRSGPSSALKRPVATWHDGIRTVILTGGVGALGGRDGVDGNASAWLGSLPAADVDVDTGGVASESSVADSVRLLLPQLTRTDVSRAAAAAAGGDSPWIGAPQFAFSIRSEEIMPEARPPRGGGVSGGAGGVAYSVGFTHWATPALSPGIPPSQTQIDCATRPLLGCGSIMV